MTTGSGGTVLLEYVGAGRGATTYMARGHAYRVAQAGEYIEAPEEDAAALVEAGKFRRVTAPPPPPEPERPEEEAPAPEPEPDALAALGGIGPEIAAALRAVGIDSPADVAAVTDEALLGIPGIGPKTLARLRAELQ